MSAAGAGAEVFTGTGAATFGRLVATVTASHEYISTILTHSSLVFPTYNGSLVWQEYQRRLDAPDYAKTLNAR